MISSSTNPEIQHPDTEILESERERDEKGKEPAQRRFIIVSFFKSLLISDLEEQHVNEIRGSLLVLATVLASMTFPPIFSPPGGLWQADYSEGPICGKKPCLAGMSILASVDLIGYSVLMALFSLSFSSSLFIIYILAPGRPLTQRKSLRGLSLGLSVSLITLALAYAGCLYAITPESVYKSSYGIILGPIQLLVGVISVMVLCDVARATSWMALLIIRKLKNALLSLEM